MWSIEASQKIERTRFAIVLAACGGSPPIRLRIFGLLWTGKFMLASGRKLQD